MDATILWINVNTALIYATTAIGIMKHSVGMLQMGNELLVISNYTLRSTYYQGVTLGGCLRLIWKSGICYRNDNKQNCTSQEAQDNCPSLAEEHDERHL